MSLKKFFRKIGQFFEKLFKGLLPDLKKAIHIGVIVTNAIKEFDLANAGTVDIITKLIPGELDDKIKDKIREELPMIMTQLQLVDNTMMLTNKDEIVASAVKTLQQLSGDYRSAFLNSLSIIVAQVASDGKLDWNDAKYLLSWYYDNQKVDEIDTAI